MADGGAGPPAEDIYRACPKGTQHGIDVARMYPEIEKIIRSQFLQRDIDVDDLIQESCLRIITANESELSRFDPTRGAGFSKYVVMVAKSKLAHMREKAKSDRLEFYDEDAVLDAAFFLRSSAGEVTDRSIGEFVAHLREVADYAHERASDGGYYAGFEDAIRVVAGWMGEFFEDTAKPARAKRKAKGGEK